MIKTDRYEDITIITTGRGIFGTYIYPVYSFLLNDLLIDTGTTKCQEKLMLYLKDKEINKIVNTHAHEDHIGNNSILKERKQVKLYAHKKAIERIENTELLNLRGYQKFAWGLPKPSQPEEIPIEINTESHTLQIIHTPGHSPGHICLYEPKKKWLFSGDLHLGKLSLESQPFENLPQIIESLKKLTHYDVKEIFCSHLGHLTDGSKLIQKKLSYLQDAKEKAENLYMEGKSPKQISKQIAGRESLMKIITRGHMSKKNGIKSLLQIE